MPAATNKADLIAITEKEWGKLTKLLDDVPPDISLRDFDGSSIKDLIAHRAHWIDLFLVWYKDGLAGKPVYFPAEGYKWNQLKAYNAALQVRKAGLDWGAARTELNFAYARLMAFYEGVDDTSLYSSPMKGANNQWTPGRWSEASGASHFRSAAKFIRACKRAA